ncbi:MAG: MFS transporter [Chloroflexi bacterium]|nr:MFS transporter [Chloroflexota bacterium]
MGTESATKRPPGMRWLGGIQAGDARWLLAISMMLFVLLFPFSSYVAALPLIKNEWGLNNTQAGIIFSAYLAGFAVSALFVLPLTDRFGSKTILISFACISVVSHILFPLLADGLVSAVVLRALAGLGLVGVYNPGMRVVAERFSTNGRGMAVGTYVTFFYASNSVSLALTGILMAHMDWRDAYLVMALLAVLSVPMAFLALRSHEAPVGGGSSGTLDLSVLKNKATRIFMLAYSLHAAELYIVRVWLPAFLVAVLVAKGVNSPEAAVTAATVGGIALATGAVGPVVGGILSDRWGRAVSASAIFALSGAVSFIIGWLIGFPWPVVVGLTALYGWAIAADSAIYSTAVTEVSEPSKLGSTLAVHSFLGFTGGVIGPIVIGGILDLSPEAIRWGLAFSVTGALSIVAILSLMRVRPPIHRTASPSDT